MATNDGVSHCYVFKSQLQEYAQKVGYPTPLYETIKEGPSHEPFFRSTVIVNKVRYDSLLGFYNRKAAEQSAAEVALVELAKLGETNANISQPVQETGLCKNLLQEYAQKMNHAAPLYECQNAQKQGRDALFTCSVEIGGIRYIGGTARSKKEAEIKAARTALLAIRSLGNELNDKATLTVIPSKRKGMDSNINTKPAPKYAKEKNGRFKARRRKNVRGNSAVLQVNVQEQNESSVAKMPITAGNSSPHCDYTPLNGQQHLALNRTHYGSSMKVSLAKDNLNKFYSVEQEFRLANDSPYTSQNGQQHGALNQSNNGTTANELLAKEYLNKFSAVEQEVRLANYSTYTSQNGQHHVALNQSHNGTTTHKLLAKEDWNKFSAVEQEVCLANDSTYTSQNGLRHGVLNQSHNGTTTHELLVKEDLNKFSDVEPEVRLANDSTYTSENGQQHGTLNQSHNGTAMHELLAKEDLNKFSAVEQQVRLANDSSYDTHFTI